MYTDKEKELKKLFKSWGAKNRDQYAKAIIQCCLIGAAAKQYPMCKALANAKLITIGRKNINITHYGYILLEMSKEGRSFLSIGKNK